MSPSDFLSELDPSRRAILSEIHRLIIETNKRVKPDVEKVMDRQMIVYKEDGIMVYGLSSPKSHMSLLDVLMNLVRAHDPVIFASPTGYLLLRPDKIKKKDVEMIMQVQIRN